MTEETIFSKIIAREIPADIVYETDDVLAFRDINAVAPTHILVIPKTPIVNLIDATEEHEEVLGRLMIAAKTVAKQEGLDSFRLVVNNGAEVGQSVFHLHLHVMGGRPFSWPPG